MIFGWDLGGAHVKLVALENDGRIHRVAQTPCELWLGLDRLESALSDLGARTPLATHAITMTGELVDLFPDRTTGVVKLVEAFLSVAGTPDIRLFAGNGFVSAREAASRWSEIASANWLATARLVAQRVLQALVIDVGSTTTDITLVAGGEVRAQGKDDHARLAAEELVYTAVVRTPLMAIASRVPFDGQWVSVMAEHFATTADVHRITGELDPDFDQARTADSAGRSREDSMRRLARMIGCDVMQAPPAAWARLARWLAHEQCEHVHRACERQLSRGLLDDAAPVVGLGVGQFLAARVAASLGREHVDYAALIGVAPQYRSAVNVCGPAFAVAQLAMSI